MAALKGFAPGNTLQGGAGGGGAKKGGALGGMGKRGGGSGTGGGGNNDWGVGNAMTTLSGAGFNAPLMYQTAAMLGQDSGFPDYDLLRKTKEAVNSAASDEEYMRSLGIQKAKKELNARPQRSSGAMVGSMKSDLSSDMDAFEQKLRDKKMFEAQLAQQNQQTQSMKVADELARLKLQQEEQKRAEIRSMLLNLMGNNGNAGTSGVAAKGWQEQLVDIGGQKFPMRVNSSESMLPQLLQSLSALAQ